LEYRRNIGTETWHWHPDCSWWPGTSPYDRTDHLPTVDARAYCNQCIVKDRRDDERAPEKLSED
jgi:hypothetical protein